MRQYRMLHDLDKARMELVGDWELFRAGRMGQKDAAINIGFADAISRNVSVRLEAGGSDPVVVREASSKDAMSASKDMSLRGAIKIGNE